MTLRENFLCRIISAATVTRLLDDIYNLKGKVGQPNRNYCLQPIVVKNLNGNKIVTVDEKGDAVISNSKTEKGYDFEIIDGQQRLTTLFFAVLVRRQKRKYF